MHEERVVGALADHPDLDAVVGIPPPEAVDHVKPLARVEVIDRALAVDVERAFIEPDVDVAPPDIFFRAGLADDTLVGRAAARLAPRADGKRPGACRSEERRVGTGGRA